ncbi:hypothetical protein CTI12_AA119540 [Artemisia annua]|uniref:Uncharacterized protein n=1 Tax=Artemisia annua TaxID=35608 RepID=A0A2U1PS79_ARTAN|nr:hypothetical protein CTI12_AA119540 [Artemisia annua]
MDHDSLSKHTEIPSLSDIINSSIIIQSHTNIRPDGKIESYCGLRIREVTMNEAGSTSNYHSPTPDIISNQVKCRRPKQNHKRIALTSTVVSLIAMLNESSAVTKAFRMVRDWCASHDTPNLQLRLTGNRSSARQYNTPSVSEVAALITNDFGQVIPSRDIIVNYKDTGKQRISELHPSYMALQKSMTLLL